MAGAEYVKHVAGSALKVGDVLVFQDYYEVLTRYTGEETHTYRGDHKPTVVARKFAAIAYNRDGSGKKTVNRRYNPGVEYPTGRLK
jgi:hypothetical protein